MPVADPQFLPLHASSQRDLRNSGPRQRPLIIAIDGRSGAGKTTVALELAALLRRHRTVSLFHLEDIYPGWDGLADGVGRYVSTVLAPLSQGSDAHWTAWDWTRDQDGATQKTVAADVVLLEGVGAACGNARQFVDAVIWVDSPALQRKERALARDGDTYAPFWDRWAAQEETLFAENGVAGFADITVDGTAGVGAEAEHLVSALAELPALEHAFAPELARRRGLEFRAERLDAFPDGPALFKSLYGRSTQTVWLDSSNAGTFTAGDAMAGRSRFSIMADDGGWFGRSAEHRAGATTVRAGHLTSRIPGTFFRWLDSVWGRKAVRAPEHYPCEFTLGWLGYLGYELKSETGGMPRIDVASPDGPGESGPSESGSGESPAAALLFAGRAVVLDHEQRCLFLLTLAEASHPASGVEAQDWCAQVRATVASLGAAALGAPPLPSTAPTFVLRDGERRYKSMIAAAQAEITEGNSYEVCLTTQLEAVTASRLDPWEHYRALRFRSPAPFAAYVRLGGLSLCSTSPERFLRIDSAGMMRAEPIKGTRRRDADPATDASLKAELAASLKDRAENIMIVDLLRNDLSHFARPESLRVRRLCEIESYATVHQMVSTIEAALAPGSSRAQAVAAAFPAGSMTGAPKISTMAILDSLEAGPRGVYSGAIGYFSLNAATDLSVVIRTLAFTDQPDGGTHLGLGVGGAITSDSDAEEEWQEIQAKAYGVLSTLGATFPS